MKDSQINNTIIGGGLTGLTLAYYLKKGGKKVNIIEKSSRVGGVIDTVTQNGFTFEKGPNTGIIGSSELVELFDDLKGKVDVEIANSTANNRWIWKDGTWYSLPSGLISAVSTPLFRLKDKFRVLGEPLRKPGINPDETIAELVKRRLGTSFLNYAVDPFISGIYAGDPNTLVTRYALPKLYNLEQTYGSFIRGAFKKRNEPKTEIEKRVSKEVFSVKGGLNQLIRVLKESIGDENIYLNATDLKVNKLAKGFSTSFNNWNNQQVEVVSENVITTINGDQLHAILPFVSDHLLLPISDLKYARVVQVIACFNVWKGAKLNAFGGLIPSIEKRNMLGVLFPSSIFKGRAPEKGAVLSIFMGGVKKQIIFEKSDEELREIALSEIRDTLKNSDKPDELHIYRYSRAIPQYDVSSGARFDAIDRIQDQHMGLILAGNIRDGIGIADRVKQAKQIALSLLT
ncbi:MAG: protoporphyrinogen oxidase [Bacteroidetes bacterium]|nr:protoporphyrinogen oxidase [Bacteroidota bacterium]MDA1122553.1 protoporphyrinogen oxidase [Bacteroidota bacterium]